MNELIEKYKRILAGAKESLKENDCEFTRKNIREYETILDALRRAQPANEPLTLDQLREMVDTGEWAWVEMNYGTLGWCKPFQKHPFSMRNVYAGYVTALDFERGFVVGAYRRKPEPEGRAEK